MSFDATMTRTLLDGYAGCMQAGQCAAVSCANDTMQAAVAPIMCTYSGAKAPYVRRSGHCTLVRLHVADQSVEDKNSMTPKFWLSAAHHHHIVHVVGGVCERASVRACVRGIVQKISPMMSTVVVTARLDVMQRIRQPLREYSVPDSPLSASDAGPVAATSRLAAVKIGWVDSLPRPPHRRNRLTLWEPFLELEDAPRPPVVHHVRAPLALDSPLGKEPFPPLTGTFCRPIHHLPPAFLLLLVKSRKHPLGTLNLVLPLLTQVPVV